MVFYWTALYSEVSSILPLLWTGTCRDLTDLDDLIYTFTTMSLKHQEHYELNINVMAGLLYWTALSCIGVPNKVTECM